MARTRPRKQRFSFDKQEIVDRVLKFYEEDDTARTNEKEARIQRYAKFRMWTEGKNWPWPDSSDFALPDIMAPALRIQDTLHNAVMSSRPPISASAVDKRNKDRQDSIDRLLDYQFFVEQSGENLIGDMADAFVVDGEYTVFIPWVKELRESSDARMFPPIPDEMEPGEYFTAILIQHFGPRSDLIPVLRSDGWDWFLGDMKISFYTTKDGVEMVTREEVVVYDGPRIIQKEWEDVLYPSRAANLHIPGPSNPHGAGHVILVDHPSIDEVRRLAKRGVYDHLTKDDLKSLDVVGEDTSNQEMARQKDSQAGTTHIQPTEKPGREQDKVSRPQKTVTRLMCFDIFDVDNDGTAEDMVWWVIKDIKKLARARLMTEIFPARKPRRPLVHQAIIPVRGRVGGISVPEMLEGLHDAMKAVLDQTIDAGTMKIIPFGFYRPSSSMKSETIHMTPGELYPLQDPQRDINFPTINTQGEVMGLNLVAIIQQMEERLSMVGDIQQGRVPQGKSSALRTASGMAMILGQGEARPERVLRRFFGGLSEIWSVMHDLNRHFLPDEKQILVTGLKSPSEDPYLSIGRGAVSENGGDFLFDFKANVLNSSKQALQQSLNEVMTVGVSAIAIQMGITDANGFYRMVRDHAKAWGLDPDQYYKEPTPGAGKRRIMAEEAISTILDGAIPEGEPAEGAGQHFQKLQDFFASDDFGRLSPEQVEIFKGYLQQIEERAAQEQEQAQIQAAAAQFGQQGQQGQPGRPPEQLPETPGALPEVGPNQLVDESLPSAGGGANTGS